MTGLDEVVGVARTALDARALLVVDRRRDPPVVAASGAAADGLAAELGGGLGRETPPRRTSGAHLVRTTVLEDPGRRPIGALHVGWPHPTGDGPGPDREAVLQAFTRHIGLTLARRADPTATVGRAGGGAGLGADDVLPWDDLGRLPDTVAELTVQVTDIVRPLTGARVVGITVWDPERRILRALPGAFGSEDDTLAASVTGPVTNMLSAGSRVFTSGQPYLSNDAGADPGVLQPYAEVFRIARLLSMPLTSRGRRVGVLHLANKPEDFTVDDVAAIEALTPRLAAAVELAGAVGRMAAQQRLEGVLADTAVAVASGSEVEDCLVPSFDRLSGELGASLVALVPLRSAPLVRRTGGVPADLEKRLVADARALVATSSGAFPRRAGDPGWAALHIPVELDGAHTATLSVLRRTGEPFTSQEEDVVARLGRLVALAWTTERHQRQLAEIARLRERERIADGLHDRVAQICFAARLGIDTVLEGGEAGHGEQGRLLEVRELLTHADSIVRDVIHRLGTGEEIGLARRLRREVESVEDEFGVVVRVAVDDDRLAAVPRSVAVAALKVVREGTVNAAKHAGPCRIGVEVGVRDGELVVEITDDGFDCRERPPSPGRPGSPDSPGSSGHGLSSLHRAVDDAGGTLAHTAVAGGFGTRLRAAFPL